MAGWCQYLVCGRLISVVAPSSILHTGGTTLDGELPTNHPALLLLSSPLSLNERNIRSVLESAKTNTKPKKKKRRKEKQKNKKLFNYTLPWSHICYILRCQASGSIMMWSWFLEAIHVSPVVRVGHHHYHLSLQHTRLHTTMLFTHRSPEVAETSPKRPSRSRRRIFSHKSDVFAMQSLLFDAPREDGGLMVICLSSR